MVIDVIDYLLPNADFQASNQLKSSKAAKRSE